MKLKHPKSDLTLEVAEENAEPYLSQGWVDVADVCSTCGAAGDDPCRTPSGAETSPHAKRP